MCKTLLLKSLLQTPVSVAQSCYVPASLSYSTACTRCWDSQWDKSDLVPLKRKRVREGWIMLSVSSLCLGHPQKSMSGFGWRTEQTIRCMEYAFIPHLRHSQVPMSPSEDPDSLQVIFLLQLFSQQGWGLTGLPSIQGVIYLCICWPPIELTALELSLSTRLWQADWIFCFLI